MHLVETEEGHAVAIGTESADGERIPLNHLVEKPSHLLADVGAFGMEVATGGEGSVCILNLHPEVGQAMLQVGAVEYYNSINYALLPEIHSPPGAGLVSGVGNALSTEVIVGGPGRGAAPTDGGLRGGRPGFPSPVDGGRQPHLDGLAVVAKRRSGHHFQGVTLADDECFLVKYVGFLPLNGGGFTDSQFVVDAVGGMPVGL